MAKHISENELIAKYFAPLSGAGAFNLTDDAALLRVKAGEELVVTTDTLVSGVHFFADARPQDIAAKALRVNLSDLAAKGAEPLGYLLALSMPVQPDAKWLKDFTVQLEKDQQHYGIALLGGDTTKSPVLTLTVTAFGSVPKGKMVKRSGAKPGDIVAVTGTVGDAALGLKVLQGEIATKDANTLVQRYHRPEPRNVLARLLRDYVTAAMDISDGFVGDLQKLCAASKVTAHIALDAIPYSKATAALVKADERLRDTTLTGGDDYEILFTINSKNWPRFQNGAQRLKIPVTQVGEVAKGPIVPAFTYKKEPRFFSRGSYQHF